MAEPRRGIKRPDIPVKEVAERWLAGETIEILAEVYGCTPNPIKLRLAKARKQFPDLPWGSRSPVPRKESVGEYTEMKDGVPGTRGVRPGSVIPMARRRR